MKITDQVVENHGLKLEEFSNIKKLMKREPNLLELGIFSAMWNEHCSYKSSRKHLKNLPTKGTFSLDQIHQVIPIVLFSTYFHHLSTHAYG